VSSNGRDRDKRSDIHLSEESGTRIQNNEVHDEKRTPDVCNSIFLRDPSGKLYVCKSNVSFCC